MLAVALPGLGQVYNRKYLKVPFVYAGFGAVLYFITYNSTRYNKYLKGYQDFTDNIPETASYLEIEALKSVDPSSYDPVIHPDVYAWYKEGMLRNADYFKRYRDLSYIGIAAWYLVTILDANVDASLCNYNVSDDIELDINPVIVSTADNASRTCLNVCLRVNF